MTGVEVFLILTGIACICFSFFVSRRNLEEGALTRVSENSPAAEVWSDKDEDIIKQRAGEILENMKNEYVEEARENMGTICNEKIMALDEFSTQIMEKINNNHQDVVFMYNMLGEKQKEIKELMTKAVRPSQEKKEEKIKSQVPVSEKQNRSDAPQGIRRIGTQAEALQQSGRTAAPTGLSQVKRQGQKKAEVEKKKPEADVSSDRNRLIQKMHKEGKSVLEISKELDIGQGEVQLVIALYGGKKSE